MVTSDALTPFLAGGVGAYLLLSATGVLAKSTALEEFVQDLRTSPALAHMTGAVAFFIGGAILLINPGFGSWIAALLSLTAVWWMAEGALMLAAPDLVVARSDAGRHFQRMNILALPVGFALIVGAILQFV